MIYHRPVPDYYHREAFSVFTRFVKDCWATCLARLEDVRVLPCSAFCAERFVLALRDREQRALNLAYGAIVVEIRSSSARRRDGGGHAFGRAS